MALRFARIEQGHRRCDVLRDGFCADTRGAQRRGRAVGAQARDTGAEGVRRPPSA